MQNKNKVQGVSGFIVRPMGEFSEDFKVKGLLLPKDEISRNGVLYDWESIKAKAKAFEGVSMNYNHIIDDAEIPVGKITKTFIKEKEDSEGPAGMYYEAEINEESRYASSIKKGFLNKVSIQVTADAQEEEYSEDGSNYTRAFIGDPLEVSCVRVPGFNGTTMEVALAEAFGGSKKEARLKVGNGVDVEDRKSGKVIDSGIVTKILGDVIYVDGTAYDQRKGYDVFKMNESFNEVVTPLPEDQADPEQLKMGIAVEMEHTDDKEEAKKIALQHLAEVPDYYTKLKAVEEGMDMSGSPGASVDKMIKKKEFKVVDMVEILSDEEAKELAESIMLKEAVSSKPPKYKAGDTVVYFGPGVGSPYYPKKNDKYKVNYVKKANNGKQWIVDCDLIGHKAQQPTNLADEFRKV